MRAGAALAEIGILCAYADSWRISSIVYKALRPRGGICGDF